MNETLKTEHVERRTMELQNKDVLFPKESDGKLFSADWLWTMVKLG